MDPSRLSWSITSYGQDGDLCQWGLFLEYRDIRFFFGEDPVKALDDLIAELQSFKRPIKEGWLALKNEYPELFESEDTQ